MKKFAAIEGLRAWLAWAVVLDHLAYWSELNSWTGSLLRNLGHPAVMTFIIVSGFVITNLITAKYEPYRVYLLRRFMRLFPLFAVTCIIGYFALKLQMQLPDRNFDPPFMAYLARIIDNTDRYFWKQAFAHTTMLHGAIPYNLLPSTDTAFNMPAWSISLEWQFYLVAPLVVVALIKRPMLVAPLLAGLFAVTQLAVHWGWFGVYDTPATLLVVGEWFGIGIASRLLLPVFEGRITQQYIPLALCIMLSVLTRQEAALAVWAIVYMGLIVPPSRLHQLALENPVALYLGSRSYSTYLGHVLVLIVVQHILTQWLGHAPGFMPLALATVPATLLLSELLYRSIEQPGIRLGSMLCKRLTPVATASVVPFKRRAF